MKPARRTGRGAASGLARVVVLLGLGVLLGACRAAPSTAVYVHPSADFATYSRIAVLPLENLSPDRFAGERVREVLFVELSAAQLFDLVETSEVNRVLRAQGALPVSEFGTEQLQRIGEALGAQALLTGSVMDYRERRTGNITAPEIALSLRLIDAETGIVVWSVADARTGMDLWTRLFGVGEESQTDSARRLVRELIATLY